MNRSGVVLLGAQRFDPTLGAVVAEVGVTGRIAVVTAGWQELENEDDELSEHLGKRIINLRLHARGEELFAADPELRVAHRERQEALRHRQDFYRIRLEHELAALHVIQSRVAPQDIVSEQADAALTAIRDLDRWHLGNCARRHSDFEARWKLSERPSVARHRAEIAEIVSGCDAVAIAGGHVATIINRLALFGIGPLCAKRWVFAWSGGAMAVSDRVVLFHDDPPQGPGASEVLDAGLGLVPNIVVLPEPEQRLHLDDRARVAEMVRRFAPSRCLAMPARSYIIYEKKKVTSASRALELRDGGGNVPFDPARAR